MTSRKAALGLGLALAAAPAVASAHVKWFVDPAGYPLRTDLILSSRTALLAGCGAAAVLIMWLLSRLAGDPHWPELPFLNKMAIGAPTLLAVQSAITLIYAAVQPTLFAPHLRLPNGLLGYGIAAAEVLTGFCFITGIADWVACLALLALVAATFALFPVFDALDQLYWAGIALAVLIIGRFAADARKARGWFHERSQVWAARGVAALRVIAGIGIVAPGLSEKVWDPELGAAFMTDHPNFNFFRLMGVDWVNDDQFVLLAGIAECTIGILLISGLLTRVVICGMWLPFNITVPFLPPTELIGHLPIFGIMYFLLVHSAGLVPGEADRIVPPGIRPTREEVRLQKELAGS